MLRKLESLVYEKSYPLGSRTIREQGTRFQFLIVQNHLNSYGVVEARRTLEISCEYDIYVRKNKFSYRVLVFLGVNDSFSPSPSRVFAGNM